MFCRLITFENSNDGPGSRFYVIIQRHLLTLPYFLLKVTF